MVKIREEYKGTRGSSYFYVVEGRFLKHISEYASSKVVEENSVWWEVPIESVGDKPIIEFSFSRSGYGYVNEFRIHDFIGSEYGKPDYTKRVWGGLLEDWPRIHDYKFEIKSPELKTLIEEYEKLYLKMISDVKAYADKLNFELFFAGHSSRVMEAFSKEPLTALYACLSNPVDESRLRSLNNVLRWIYQLWVLKLISEALGTQNVERRPWSDKPYWWIEQGKPTPTCVFKTSCGFFTIWFEFQEHEMAHLAGMFITDDKLIYHSRKARVHVRPDIVMVKGIYNDAKKLVRIDLIVECKHEDFKYWEKDIGEQIPAYIKSFKPNLLILASLKSVPVNTKLGLSKKGVRVIDYLGPENPNQITEFKQLIYQVLCKYP